MVLVNSNYPYTCMLSLKNICSPSTMVATLKFIVDDKTCYSNDVHLV